MLLRNENGEISQLLEAKRIACAKTQTSRAVGSCVRGAREGAAAGWAQGRGGAQARAASRPRCACVVPSVARGAAQQVPPSAQSIRVSNRSPSIGGGHAHAGG